MRLDLFLKTSRLIVRRTLAQEFCDEGLVQVNGSPAKSSKDLKAGDEIQIQRGNRVTLVKILQIPEKKQVPRHDAPELYEIVSETVVEDDIFG